MIPEIDAVACFAARTHRRPGKGDGERPFVDDSRAAIKGLRAQGRMRCSRYRVS